MPEHLRALIVVLGLAAMAFWFSGTFARECGVASSQFNERRRLWFLVTLTAFLAHSFWLFLFVAASLIVFLAPRGDNKIATFYFLLFAVPVLRADVGGGGVVNYLFSLDYIRLLTLLLLLPAFVSTGPAGAVRFGRSSVDVAVAAYLLLNLLLQFRIDTFTNTLRHSVFYAFVDVVLPYYAARRCAQNLGLSREAIASFVMAALVLAAIGAFEAVRHWLLYAPLGEVLDVDWAYGNYLERTSGRLRAQGSTGQPIAFGYVMVVAIAFCCGLRQLLVKRSIGSIALIALAAGLLASLSRGPWVGAVAAVVVFLAAGARGGRHLVAAAVLFSVAAVGLVLAPGGSRLIEYLPFVGSVDSYNVDYRTRLLEVSWYVMWQNPLLGSPYFRTLPEMQELRQGEGIIDVVNTFMGIGMSSGVVGLACFAGVFLLAGLGVLRRMRACATKTEEAYVIGQALVAALVGIVIVLFTVSSITVIPVIYWSVIGLAVGYAHHVPVATGAAVEKGQTTAVLSASPMPARP